MTVHLDPGSYFCFSRDQTTLTITVQKKDSSWNTHKNRAYSYLKTLENYAVGDNTIAIQKGFKIDEIAKIILARYEAKTSSLERAWDRFRRFFCTTKREKMEQIVDHMEQIAKANPLTSSSTSTSSFPQAKRKCDGKPYEDLDFFKYYSEITSFQMDIGIRHCSIFSKFKKPEANAIEDKSNFIIKRFCELYNLVDFEGPNLLSANDDNIKKMKEQLKAISTLLAKDFFSKGYPNSVNANPPFEAYRNENPDAIKFLEEAWTNYKGKT